jgi:hypothetical protein
LLSVHVLREFVYCPRAAILALDMPHQDEEPVLGPRLDGVLDYDDHRFAEAIRALRQRLTNSGLAVTGVLLAMWLLWRWFSPLASMVGALPLAYLWLSLFHDLKRLTTLVGARGRLKSAAELNIDWNSQEAQQVNWWSLRKAGYDCLKPVEANEDRVRSIVGKPWRILTKEVTQRIPVIRKHLGGPSLRDQHRVGIAAYCELLVEAEGVDAPFGIVVIAGSETCWLVPNTPALRQRYAADLERLRNFLATLRQPEPDSMPAPREEAVCRHCPLGKLRRFDPARATQDSLGRTIKPRLIGKRHSPCGDRFNWDPPQAT